MASATWSFPGKGLPNPHFFCRRHTTPFPGVSFIFLQSYDTGFGQSLEVVEHPGIGDFQGLRDFRNRLPILKDFEDAPTKWIG